MIFCSGACSQVDTFDYKPELIKRHGQPLPGAEDLVYVSGSAGNLTKSPWEFKPRGPVGQDDFGACAESRRAGGRHVFYPFDDRQDEHTWAGRELHVDWLYAGWFSKCGRMDDLGVRNGE